MIVSVIIIVRENVTVSVNAIVSIRVSVSVSASVSASIVTIGMSAPSSQGVAVPTSGEGGVSAPPSATAIGEF